VYVQRNHFSLLVRQFGQRRTEQPQLFVAGYEPARIAQALLSRTCLLRTECFGPAATRTHQITDAIGNAPGKVGLKTTRQPETHNVLSKSNERIVNGIFGEPGIVRKSNSQNEQIISVLFIDPAQSVPAPLPTSGHKQPVYHQGNLMVE